MPADQVFADWAELAAAGRLGDAVVIATQDQMHADPAVAFAELGYHILLEKPMATTEADALRIAAAVDAGRGHLRRLPRAALHALHPDAEGACSTTGRSAGWSASSTSSRSAGGTTRTRSYAATGATPTPPAPLLLTKSCHDIDWLLYLIGAAPTRVSSFGGLSHFRRRAAPGRSRRHAASTARSSRRCPYSAPRLYLSCLGDPAREFWPLSAVTTDHTDAGVEAALRTGPYGRCVYGSDNDVVDHQVVTMEFADGATCSFTMTAFTPMEHRRTRLFGTHGYVDGDDRLLHVTDFRTGGQWTIDTDTDDGSTAARRPRRRRRRHHGRLPHRRRQRRPVRAALRRGRQPGQPPRRLGRRRARTTGTVVPLPA